MKPRLSRKAAQFGESVIREMTRLAQRHGAVNLSQGFPDFPAPEAIKEAACRAIRADVNQYAITWGAKSFRDALAAKTRRFRGIEIDPERELTVTCGSTEAMIATILATTDPGDEVVVFEPYYENYWPDAVLSGATPRFVKLRPPDWTFDEAELAAAFNGRTRAIVLCNPNNPTGKVFSRAELGTIARLCVEHDVIAISDEIYEHIVFDGREHVLLESLPGMRERTVIVSGMSKTYSVTGWRIGYCIAPEEITLGIRKVHDFLTVGAAAPLQEAGAVALAMPDEYYSALAADYQRRREIMLGILDEVGVPYFRPSGAYYVMADIGGFGFENDTAFTRHLIERIGVACVPGSSFFVDPRDGRDLVRFCFCKRDETLGAARERLLKLRPA